MSALATKHLRVGYRQGKTETEVQTDLNLYLNREELVCLIGPNGTGKSTLLRTLAGLQKKLNGEIFIENKPLAQYTRKEIARQIALVLTDKVQVENGRVYDIVALGQIPYSHWLGGLTLQQKTAIDNAIELTHLHSKTEKFFNELSDGEKQRVMIAKALAQNTSLIFLDEPTAHLDLPNRVEIMLLLHKLAHTTGKAILLSTHELDLALQAADKIWLMNKNGVISGVPEDMVLSGLFNQVFKSNAYFFNPSNGNFSMNYPLKKRVNLQGDKTRMYWTLRALARAGFYVSEDASVNIEITQGGWNVENNCFSTIEELLPFLSKYL